MTDDSYTVYDRCNLPDTEWLDYQKNGTTSMAATTGPFSVLTKEGPYRLPPGWVGYLALDAEGYPYPVEAAVSGLPLGYERAS